MKKSFLDKTLEKFAPKLALKRIQTKNAIKIAERKYTGASQTKRTSGWTTVNEDTNNSIAKDLPKLRERVLDLYKNNPYISRAVKTIVTKTIGSGIIPAINIKKKQGVEDKIKSRWDDWIKKCDFDKDLNFYGLQRLITRTVLLSGEAIIVRRFDQKDKKNPLRIQVFSGEHIDLQKTSPNEKGNVIIHGIEFNKHGQKVATWINPIIGNMLNIHNVSVRIANEHIIHTFKKEFPKQLHGVPHGTSAIIRSKDFDDFEDAELMKQKIASCFVAFVHDIADNGVSNDEELNYEQVSPGIIEKLPPGKTVSFGTPPQNNSYHLYTKTMLHGIAAGMEVSYESMTSDYSQVNFSSAKMSDNEVMRLIKQYQEDVITHKVCEGVFNWFLEVERVNINYYEDDIKVSWTPPRREFIDPVKETKALGEGIRLGLFSWQEVARSLGKNPEDLIKELKQDSKMFEAAGLMPSSDPKYDTNRFSSSEKPIKESKK